MRYVPRSAETFGIPRRAAARKRRKLFVPNALYVKRALSMPLRMMLPGYGGVLPRVRGGRCDGMLHDLSCVCRPHWCSLFDLFRPVLCPAFVLLGG